MIYGVRHVTEYKYAAPVDLGAHIVHLRPRELPWQRIIANTLDVDPPTARVEEGTDYFGNLTTWMFLDTPHPSFRVTMEAAVDVRFPDPPPPRETLPWESVALAALRFGPATNWLEEGTAADFLFDSPMVPNTPEAREYAAPCFAPGRPILQGLLQLNTSIFKDFAFRTGVTDLSTSVSEVLSLRAGVCQDFAHLMVASLRGLGLPARYVSGYIRTWPPPGQARRRGADQSHAWVSVWLGPRQGWVDLDPTNGIVVRDEHVVLAWGRDYSDVSPVRGIILGGGSHGVSVSVDLEPIEESVPERK